VHCLVCGSPYLIELTRLRRIPSSAQYFISRGLDNHHTISPSTDLIAYQCFSCTHVQTDTKLVPYYKDVISAASLSSHVLEKRDAVINRIVHLLGVHNPKFLEIGAFQGQYLEHLINIGFSNVFGIEHNPASVLLGRKRGVNLIPGYILDDTPLESELPKADILLCFNFLEHMPDPFLFLLKVKNKFLANPAYLYLTMPSFEYIREANLLQEFVPDHLSYFTLQSLQTLFLRASFEIVQIDEINNNNDLEIVARSTSQNINPLNPHPLSSLIDSINSILVQSHLSNKRVAFWGAGHRSLTLISQLLFQNIESIVDSAPFKQGLLCPDTSIPIISPDTFFDDPAQVLLLSLPGIYADEVCKMLSQQSLNIEQAYIISGNTISIYTLNNCFS